MYLLQLLFTSETGKKSTNSNQFKGDGGRNRKYTFEKKYPSNELIHMCK